MAESVVTIMDERAILIYTNNKSYLVSVCMNDEAGSFDPAALWAFNVCSIVFNTRMRSKTGKVYCQWNDPERQWFYGVSDVNVAVTYIGKY